MMYFPSDKYNELRLCLFEFIGALKSIDFVLFLLCHTLCCSEIFLKQNKIHVTTVY